MLRSCPVRRRSSDPLQMSRISSSKPRRVVLDRDRGLEDDNESEFCRPHPVPILFGTGFSRWNSLPQMPVRPGSQSIEPDLYRRTSARIDSQHWLRLGWEFPRGPASRSSDGRWELRRLSRVFVRNGVAAIAIPEPNSIDPVLGRGSGRGPLFGKSHPGDDPGQSSLVFSRDPYSLPDNGNFDYPQSIGRNPVRLEVSGIIGVADSGRHVDRTERLVRRSRAVGRRIGSGP